MTGISSKALAFGNPDNKKKYNGIELETDFGIDIYDAQLRELDQQVGRWWQIDPKTENMEMWSPYVSNYNNPLRYSDPLGDEGQECCWEEFKNGVKWINNNLNPLVPVAELITGKSLDSDFTESKPRSESAVQTATFLIPTEKAGVIILNEAKNVIVSQIEKQAFKAAEQRALAATEKQAAATVEKQATKAAGQVESKEAIVVTQDGVALPKGDKHKIPNNYVENPNRSGSYGVIENGKFKEKLRIDPATAPEKKGPNNSHYHLDGKGQHYSPNGKDKDPGFK